MPLAASNGVFVPCDLFATNNRKSWRPVVLRSDVVGLLTNFVDMIKLSFRTPGPPTCNWTHCWEKRPQKNTQWLLLGFDTDGWASGCCLGIGSTYNLRQETVCCSGAGGKKWELVTICHNEFTWIHTVELHHATDNSDEQLSCHALLFMMMCNFPAARKKNARRCSFYG